jgi:phospholipid transport system substrate-binding protein
MPVVSGAMTRADAARSALLWSHPEYFGCCVYIMEIMKTLMKIFSVTAFAAGMLAFTGSALAQEAPDELIRRVSREVITIAKENKEIQSGNRQRIMQLVETKILPHTDFQRATALVTGRYWRVATPLQQEQLTEEFRKLLIYSYSGAMSQVRDQQIDVKPLRADPADTDVVVRSEFRKSRGAEPVQVSYHLAKSADGWKIYDVNVMGVWLGLTYKESFATELNKGGIDGLIRTLSEKNKQLAASTGARPS